ncbi:GNAT family N-acetyltransferase [Ammoniphilus sp. 3BR4]|uniref:GNAT family N-acetyltransferase n=1 Tax=Ammoniphilus sp. 3BR4 TaxID=3158265 RepID=UPI003467B122
MSENNGLSLIKLNQDRFKQYLPDLLEVEEQSHQKWGNKFSNEMWDQSHFLSDLPGKFEVSYGVVAKNRLVGFVICSIPLPDTCHLHRLAVHPNYAGREIGKMLLAKVYENWLSNNQLKWGTAIIRTDHRASLPLAHHLGVNIADGPFLERYFQVRGKTSMKIFDDHFMDEDSIRYVLVYLKK